MRFDSRPVSPTVSRENLRLTPQLTDGSGGESDVDIRGSSPSGQSESGSESVRSGCSSVSISLESGRSSRISGIQSRCGSCGSTGDFVLEVCDDLEANLPDQALESIRREISKHVEGEVRISTSPCSNSPTNSTSPSRSRNPSGHGSPIQSETTFRVEKVFRSSTSPVSSSSFQSESLGSDLVWDSPKTEKSDDDIFGSGQNLSAWLNKADLSEPFVFEVSPEMSQEPEVFVESESAIESEIQSPQVDSSQSEMLSESEICSSESTKNDQQVEIEEKSAEIESETKITSSVSHGFSSTEETKIDIDELLTPEVDLNLKALNLNKTEDESLIAEDKLIANCEAITEAVNQAEVQAQIEGTVEAAFKLEEVQTTIELQKVEPAQPCLLDIENESNNLGDDISMKSEYCEDNLPECDQQLLEESTQAEAETELKPRAELEVEVEEEREAKSGSPEAIMDALDSVVITRTDSSSRLILNHSDCSLDDNSSDEHSLDGNKNDKTQEIQKTQDIEKTKDDIEGDITEDDVIDAVSDATIDDDDVPVSLFKTDHQNVLLPDFNTSKPVQPGFNAEQETASEVKFFAAGPRIQSEIMSSERGLDKEMSSSLESIETEAHDNMDVERAVSAESTGSAVSANEATLEDFIKKSSGKKKRKNKKKKIYVARRDSLDIKTIKIVKDIESEVSDIKSENPQFEGPSDAMKSSLESETSDSQVVTGSTSDNCMINQTSDTKPLLDENKLQTDGDIISKFEVVDVAQHIDLENQPELHQEMQEFQMEDVKQDLRQEIAESAAEVKVGMETDRKISIEIKPVDIKQKQTVAGKFDEKDVESGIDFNNLSAEKSEVKTEVKTEAKSEMEAGVQSRVDFEVESIIEAVVKAGVGVKVESEVEPQVEARFQNKLKAEVKAGVEANVETEQETEIDTKAETVTEISQELKNDYSQIESETQLIPVSIDSTSVNADQCERIQISKAENDINQSQCQAENFHGSLQTLQTCNGDLRQIQIDPVNTSSQTVSSEHISESSLTSMAIPSCDQKSYDEKPRDEVQSIIQEVESELSLELSHQKSTVEMIPSEIQESASDSTEPHCTDDLKVPELDAEKDVIEVNTAETTPIVATESIEETVESLQNKHDFKLKNLIRKLSEDSSLEITLHEFENQPVEQSIDQSAGQSAGQSLENLEAVDYLKVDEEIDTISLGSPRSPRSPRSSRASVSPACRRRSLTPIGKVRGLQIYEDMSGKNGV